MRGKRQLRKERGITMATDSSEKKATDKSEEKGFTIYTAEHKRYFVKARTIREAIDILETADLTPKDERVEFRDAGDFAISGISDGSNWIEGDELEEVLAEAEEEGGE